MGKIILITGSNKGIGFALSKKILSDLEDCEKLIMTARDIQKLQFSSHQIADQSKIDLQVLDVRLDSNIRNLVNYVAIQYGRVDVLINNAGVKIRVNENFEQIIQETLSCNFYGTVNMSEAFLPLMAPHGHIINFSSSQGTASSLSNLDFALNLLRPDLSLQELFASVQQFETARTDSSNWVLSVNEIYGMSKCFVNAYTRIKAKVLADSGISVRVNAVHPGWIKTDMSTVFAPLSLEEGVVVPFQIVKDTSFISGEYFSAGFFSSFT